MVGPLKYVLGAVIIVLLIACGYLEITKLIVQRNLAEAQTDNVALASKNEDFAAQVATANAALEAAHKASQQRAQAAQDAIRAANATASQYLAYARSVARLKPVGKDDCRAANGLINEYIRRGGE